MKTHQLALKYKANASSTNRRVTLASTLRSLAPAIVAMHYWDFKKRVATHVYIGVSQPHGGLWPSVSTVIQEDCVGSPASMWRCRWAPQGQPFGILSRAGHVATSSHWKLHSRQRRGGIVKIGSHRSHCRLPPSPTELGIWRHDNLEAEGWPGPEQKNEDDDVLLVSNSHIVTTSKATSP